MRQIHDQCQEHHPDKLHIKVRDYSESSHAYTIIVCAQQPDVFTNAVSLVTSRLIETYKHFNRNLAYEIWLPAELDNSTYFVQPFFTQITIKRLNEYACLLQKNKQLSAQVFT